MNKSIYLHPFFVLAIIALGSTSCSTTKVATGNLQQIKIQTPAEGKGLVYVIRPSSVGGVVGFNVTCDEKHIGTTTGKRFIYAQLEPGMHHIISKAENKAEIYLEVEAGQVYYLQQKVKMGLLIARNDLERISEAAGKAALGKCKMSGDCPAYKAVN